jgi:hypothetical protein
MARWHSCNVLQSGADARQLWQFDARNGEFALNRAHRTTPGQPLPGGVVNKSWSSIWQPRLNVAWLPAGSIFLRVVHLPPGSFDETFSMVELQLEKLSPFPVTQVVWSVHVLPHLYNGLQTLIVMFAERRVVEELLGQLEGEGFLADRLELPVLDQIQATVVNEDGAWIYPGAGGDPNTALAAWWYGGALQSLNFITLPAIGDRAAGLREDLGHIMWSGEMDGWLTSPPTWHLVADGTTATMWEAPLREALSEPVSIATPLTQEQLAALTAKRAAHSEPKSNLMPPEFATRYRQQFVDRLWLRGLGAIGAVYGIVVAIYFGVIAVQGWRVGRVESKVKAQSLSYTNAQVTIAKYNLLQEREDLKYAALDCWQKVAEFLPESLQLDRYSLFEGRRLTLSGTAPSDQQLTVLEFAKNMRKATVKGVPLFDETKDDNFRNIKNAGGTSSTWSFVLELKRTESR